ncbi:MAG: sugar transferase [Methylococcaceae bacterium]
MNTRCKNPNKNQYALPGPCFLELLHIERLRAERSGSALSLILIDLGHGRTPNDGSGQLLLRFLHDCTRISDKIGILDTGTMALLLPDTGLSGAQDVASHISTQSGRLYASLMVATFPHQVFERLLNGTGPNAALNPFLHSDVYRPKPLEETAKRLMDIILSLSAIIVLSPLMALLVMAIRISSEGQAIYRQERLGRNAAPFTLYKFRTMYHDSSEILHKNYVSQYIRGVLPEPKTESEKPEPYKIRQDPRITPLGHILRTTSLDELPQLFNILKGEMSLVGPRPAIDYEAREYQAWHLRRILVMKPGLTGLWQVEGRSATRFDDMVRMDIRYIQGWSLWMDMKILMQTAGVVLSRRGGF